MEQLIHAKQAIKNSSITDQLAGYGSIYFRGARQRSSTEIQGLPVKIRSQRQLKVFILPEELDARCRVTMERGHFGCLPDHFQSLLRSATLATSRYTFFPEQFLYNFNLGKRNAIQPRQLVTHTNQ